jgi:hypothetical protein
MTTYLLTTPVPNDGPEPDIYLLTTSKDSLHQEARSFILNAEIELAIIDTNQIASPVDRGYFERVQPIYEKHGQAEEHRQLPTADDIVPNVYDELMASSCYDDVRLFRYPWDQCYTSRRYADLLRSYSGSQSIPEEQREALIHELCYYRY